MTTTNRPTGVAVRTLTAKEVSTVLKRFGYYLSDADYGTARAIADALNDVLLTRADHAAT